MIELDALIDYCKDKYELLTLINILQNDFKWKCGHAATRSVKLVYPHCKVLEMAHEVTSAKEMLPKIISRPMDAKYSRRRTLLDLNIQSVPLLASKQPDDIDFRIVMKGISPEQVKRMLVKRISLLK